MEYLETLTDQSIFPNPEFEKPAVFEKRTTVKAVVINGEGKFAFVTNPIHSFYLLPGGGAESEDLEKEIKRECEEEIDFEVEILSEIGRIHEYRNRESKEYETICFSAKTLKTSLVDSRTADEMANDLKVVWLDKSEITKILNEQTEKVKRGEVGFYNTAFNIVRDQIFFNKYLEQSN